MIDWLLGRGMGFSSHDLLLIGDGCGCGDDD